MQHRPTPVRLTRLPTRPAPTTGSLALKPGEPPRPEAVRSSGGGSGGPGGGRVRVAGGGEVPEVGRIVRLVVEALVGARGLRQVGPWVTPQVAWELSRPKAARRLMSAPRVMAWRVQYPGEQIAEVSAVAEVGGRFHAVAMRLESMRGRWRCAAVETTIPVR